MAVKKLNPYLNLPGTAAQAINLYERALGAKADHVMRMGDVPGNDFPADAKDRVMHAVLHLDGGVIMLSDLMPNMPVPEHTNMHVCLDFDDVGDMKQKFAALSEGGRVQHPIHSTFWGGQFGALTDAFGVSWLFNCTPARA